MDTSESSPTRDVVSSENTTQSSSNAPDNITTTKHTTNTVTTFNNVPWPVRPSQGINYNFVAMMYLAGSGIAIFFLLLEKQILAPLLLEDENNNNSGNNVSLEDEAVVEDETEDGDDINPWKEFAKGMEGMYVIFIPFIPCLLWSLVVRYYWLKETNIESRKKKDD